MAACKLLNIHWTGRPVHKGKFRLTGLDQVETEGAYARTTAPTKGV
eukprot:SAG11_NODE_888_length_6693_cov_2.506218_1_plen_45_part_10